MRKEDFPVGRTLITITLYLFKHEGLLCRFFIIFFQKISAINVINAAVIPQPMTTYTPNILGKSIRFWDSAAKRKKRKDRRETMEKKRNKGFWPKVKSRWLDIGQALFILDREKFEVSKNARKNEANILPSWPNTQEN